MKLSLIVPCFNEQDNICEFYNVCKETLESKFDSYEFIFINDGSSDNTFKVMKKLYDCDMAVRIINFSRNFGKEAAMYAGFQHASGEYVTVIDADLQQRPEIILEMVDFLEKNDDYDSVAAYQEKRSESRLLSFLKNSFYHMINKACDIDFQAGASDFRTFKKKVVQAILEVKEYYRFSKGIFSWVGFNTYYMPYRAQQRKHGKTTWSLGKLIKYAGDGFVSFSTVPLRISTVIGCLFSLFALIYIIVVVCQKLFWGIAVPGYPTIVVLILLIGGIQMITLGIIGEYIAHIYIEGKRRPIYIAKDILSHDD